MKNFNLFLIYLFCFLVIEKHAIAQVDETLLSQMMNDTKLNFEDVVDVGNSFFSSNPYKKSPLL